MNLQDYQKAAARTAGAYTSDSERRMSAAMGLVGEFGEVVDVLKKVRFQGAGKYEDDPEYLRLRARHAELVADKFAGTDCMRLDELTAYLEPIEAELDDVRRQMDDITERIPRLLAEELGDCLWYASLIATINNDVLTRAEWDYAEYSIVEMAHSVAELALAVSRGGGVHVRLIVAMLCTLIERHGLVVEDVLEGNIAKLEARYPGGFSEEASRGRA